MPEHRVKEIFVGNKTQLGRYFGNQAYHAARLKNAVLYVQRNTMNPIKVLVSRSGNLMWRGGMLAGLFSAGVVTLN